jgi:transposase-like protein
MGWEEFDVTDKPGSDGAARTGMGLTFEHCQYKGLNNRTEKPGGECASADAAAQEDHQAVHIRPTPEAPRLYPRSDRHPLHFSPPRHVVIKLPVFA